MKPTASQTNVIHQGFTTQILHSPPAQSSTDGGVHTPIQPSVTYTYSKVEELIDAFQGRSQTYTYARSNSPTVSSLEKRLTLLEEGTATLCMATGMAAILLPLLVLLRKGEHILASKHIFGNTVNLFQTLRRVGIDVELVDMSTKANIAAKLRKETRILFFETIANPLTIIPDLAGIQELAEAAKLITIADNTITTPYYFKPKTLGFTFAHHSLSKYIGGHAAALGGALTELGNYAWEQDPGILSQYRDTAIPVFTQLRKRGMRDMGSVLSPQAAATIALGMETMALRLQRICDSSDSIAAYLNKHSKVAAVHHPSLPQHPQHARMLQWYTRGGGILSFELKPQYNLYKLMNALKVFRRATHLGDTRSLAIPVAPTIFFEAGIKGRKELGISETLIRLSIGIEESSDLLSDLEQALSLA